MTLREKLVEAGARALVSHQHIYEPRHPSDVLWGCSVTADCHPPATVVTFKGDGRVHIRSMPFLASSKPAGSDGR